MPQVFGRSRLAIAAVAIGAALIAWAAWRHYQSKAERTAVTEILRQAQNSGKPEEAQRVLEEAASRYPGSADLRAALGSVLLNSQPDQALSHVRAALGMQPDHARALDVLSAAHLSRRIRATSRQQLGEFIEKEIEDYADVLKRAGGDVPAVLYRSSLSRLQLYSQPSPKPEHLDTACDEASRALRATPSAAPPGNRASAHWLVGTCNIRRAEAAARARNEGEVKARLTDAAAEFRKALEIAPEHRDAAVDYAATLRAQKRGEQVAPAMLSYAGRTGNSSAKAVLLSLAGVAQASEGQTAEAAKTCQAAVAAEAKQPAGYMCSFLLQQNSGNIAGAEAALREAVEKNPNFVGGYLALENMYERTGRKAEAIATLEKVLAVHPLQATLGTVLSPLPMAANEVYYRTAIRLARLHLENGDTTKALQAAARAQTHGGPGREVREVVARVAIKTGDYKKALEALEPLMNHNPSAEERVLLAQAYFAVGHNDRARSHLDAVVRGPETPIRAEAQKMLSRLRP